MTRSGVLRRAGAGGIVRAEPCTSADHLRRLRRGASPVSTALRLKTPSRSALVARLLSVAVPASGRALPAYRSALVPTAGQPRLLEERDRLLERTRDLRFRLETAMGRLRAIQNVTSGALSLLSFDDLLRELLSRLRLVLRADSATVLLLPPGGRHLTVRATQGTAGIEPGVAIPIGRGIAGRVVTRRHPILIENLGRRQVADPGLPKDLRSVVAVPLTVEGLVVGVLEAGARHRRRFTEDDLHLVATAGERVALAVERERLREEAHVGRERLLELAGRMLDVQDQERRAIARELHDEIGQLLTGLLCFLESEDRSVGAGSADARSARGYRARMRRMKGLVTDVLARVRGLCVDLKSVGEGPRGFEKTLRWHLTRYTAQTGIQVRFRAAVNGSRIPSDLQAACFRIVQESLTNVVRHARTGEAEVRVRAGAITSGGAAS